MLEEVGESRATQSLVRRPHMVPQIDRDDRGGVIFRQRDEQAVRQSSRFDRNAHPYKLHWRDNHRNPGVGLLVRPRVTQLPILALVGVAILYTLALVGLWRFQERV